MALIIVYESFLYYSCLSFIAYYVLNCNFKKSYLYSSFSIFILLTIIAIYGSTGMLNFAYLVFSAMQFLLIKIIFIKIKISPLLFSYVLIYCINTIVISIATTFIPSNHLQIDLLVNSASAALCSLICLSKIRFKLRQVLAWTPRYALIITSGLLISSTLFSGFMGGSPNSDLQPTWTAFLRITWAVMQLVICTSFPILMLNSISSNRLKALTENYEQQIHVQAEHYKNLAAANFETRRFKHDFKNMSIAIEKLLADGRHEQALELLRQYNNTLHAPGALHPTFDTGNGIADALLTDKSEKASAINAEITFDGAIPQDSLSPTDLCVILGNTLDNAIEACQKLDPKMNKVIAIDCNCRSGFLFLSISNPVSEKVIIHDNYISTTKENKTLHGFGLYSLQNVVKRYDGEVRLSSTDNCFTVDIDMCATSPQKTESCLPQ